MGNVQATQKGVKKSTFELQTTDGRWVSFTANVEYVQAKRHQILLGKPFLKRLQALIDCLPELAYVCRENGDVDTFKINCPARYRCECPGTNETVLQEVNATFPEHCEDQRDFLIDSRGLSQSDLYKRFLGQKQVRRSNAVLSCRRGALQDTRWTQVAENQMLAAERDAQAKEYAVRLSTLEELRVQASAIRRQANARRARTAFADGIVKYAEALGDVSVSPTQTPQTAQVLQSSHSEKTRDSETSPPAPAPPKWSTLLPS